MDKPIHGNYHGYYTKRQSVLDPRLFLIPQDIWRGAHVLDIGCNEGWITCEIAQSFGVESIVGVDIDDVLVKAAWKRRRTVWSNHGPGTTELDPDRGSSEDRPAKRRRMQTYQGDGVTLPKFPAAFEHMFGPLPIPPPATTKTDGGEASVNEQTRFPHNVTFRTADWVKDGVLDDRNGYDVILAFSLTKWVHLNDGDDGLLKLFKRVHSVLRSGGVFILEPQEWETYSKAKRIDSKLKENATSLKLRPSDFGCVLREIGFSEVENLGTTGKGGFRRPVDLYRKVSTT